MIWTTLAPTKEGWYWFSRLGNNERIVCVYHRTRREPTVSDESFYLFDLNGHR
jgi:hypothetical protein